MIKIGLIVNPIAGMGGAVALKGTDGEYLDRARAMGAVPKCHERVASALSVLKDQDMRWITCSGPMGGDILRDLGFPHRALPGFGASTTGSDTVTAAEAMLKEDVDLLVFAGGDGTARDVASVVGQRLTVLGIPAGVKIHSAVFAKTPKLAGYAIREYVEGVRRETRPAEVMDIDEDLFRMGQVSARLFGYMNVPVSSRSMQAKKSGRHIDSSKVRLEEVAASVADLMERGTLYLLGSGSTVTAVSARLVMDGTLLGVDAVLDGCLVGKDLCERGLLDLIDRHDGDIKIVVSPIGGQGFIFGRGNQQFSPAVIRAVGKENIVVMATQDKMDDLFGRPLLVDTGDERLDEELCGYVSVFVGWNRKVMWFLSDS
ncbi:MAG: ATP-NAD kinase family protein [Dethiosulfovibrio sp.]|nr:ATP-NAD kinase family protein [Dethiosulfovibrio sp.]